MIFSVAVVSLFISFATGEWAWLLANGLTLAMASGSSKAQAQQLDKAKILISQHARELAIRKRQLVVVQNYGVIDRSAWVREIGFFIKIGRASCRERVCVPV